ncbi:MFS transporter [Streptomyces uncialis]|uniref:MFS transporter n=1 Tax=Streptomyces uncialis TaxID=1048205 RepID=UPI0037B1637A
MTVKDRAAGTGRQARSVLLSVIGLHLVAETALTPFLPQLFDRLYDIEDPQATGVYIWICRIVGLAALPLWGLAARRWTLHRLVLAGLCGSAVFDLLLGMAPSYAAYTVLSTLVVATNSALLLAYPAFIAEHGDESEDGEGGRLAGVCTLVVVFHLSVVVSTLVGAGVLALPNPRIGISAFAVLDILLAVLTYRILGRRSGARAAAPAPVPLDAEATATDTAATGTAPRTAAVPGVAMDRRAWFTVLAFVAMIGVAFDFSVNVARPFFTEFSEGLGSGSVGSAVLFFLPSLSALAVLPLVRRCHARLGDRLLPAALAVGTVGLAWSWLADSLPALVGGRLLYGVGLGLGQVAVELWVFRATGTAGPAYTAVETVRNAGLLAAPLAAAAAVSHDLALPLAVAAAVQFGAVLLALRRSRATVAGTPPPPHDPPPNDPPTGSGRTTIAGPAPARRAPDPALTAPARSKENTV